MRKIYAVFLAGLLTATIWAQSPQKMSYQAVIRNAGGALVTNQEIGMQISILQGSATGTLIYAETQSPTTNSNGLTTLEIGSGTPVTGTFAGIDWSTGTYFIKTETDPAGGTNYTITGTSQMLSVPYALFADKVQTVSGRFCYRDKDGDGFGYMYESVWVPDGTDPPAYYVNNKEDCNDNDYYTQDGSTEICDGIDNNCNGLIDEYWPELGQMCTEGSGACMNVGYLICNPGDPS